MKKIILLCAAGMSTSLLVTKIQKAAKDEGLDFEIAASPISQFQHACKGADTVLLGPQIRSELTKVKAALSCPVEGIDPVAYGMMDGKAVVKQINKLLAQ